MQVLTNSGIVSGLRGLMALALIVVTAAPASAAGTDERPTSPIRVRNGAVASVSGPASDVGVAALRRGGTAVDAAIATSFALAVTYPAAGNIGGGGFMMVVPSDSRFPPTMFDFREVAPLTATRDMFVDPRGRTPHRRVGVPGIVRGLELAHQKHGKLPWRELVTPAVALARDGFPLDAANARMLNRLLQTSDKQQFAELHRVFGKPGGGDWQAGDRLLQPDLAKTLQRIADGGAEGFYAGETARLLTAEMERGGGLICQADLTAYRALEREPVCGTYRGYEILGAPPVSSGGTALIEALNILETFDLKQYDRFSPECLHLLIEASRRAYRDRARYLGDPAFVKVPGKLLTKEYARELARGIDPQHATPSAELAGDISLRHESDQTTHFSVIDGARTAVSLTCTLENSFGSRVVVPGAGFLLNDEMNDFNWLPRVTDTNGRIGTDANLLVPGKRMVSSMCPIVVRRDGRVVLVTGSPGGRTIINTVLNVVVNVLDFGMNLQAAVDAPRFHHQWFPDVVQLEPALVREHPQTIERLKAMGHAIATKQQGDAHSLLVDTAAGEIVGAADQRISGKAAGY